MNKKLLKNRPLQLLAMLLLISSACCWAVKPESLKKKEISQSFNISMSDQLVADNRYGSITVTHWNKNEASIRVVIEAKAASEKAAQAAIDRVQIEIGKTGNIVSAITTLKESRNGNSGNLHFTIDYFINIPSKLTIDLSQKYGNINLPEKNEGKSTIHVKYGNLNAGSFTANLDLEAKYGNVDMGNVKTASLDLGYCGNVTIKNAVKLDIDSKYSNMDINDCQQIILFNKYGNFKMQNVDKADLDIKYSEASIAFLKEELNLGDLSYSTLTVKEVSANFRNINVDARYGNLNLGIPASASFNVAAENMKYGSYDIKGFKITNSSVEEKVNHYSEINGGKKGKIYFDGNNYSNIKIKAL